MARLTRLILLLAALATAALPAGAELVFSLLTFHPGKEFFQLEGHTGLRLIDTDTGSDITYNWGAFDFTTPGFAYRFCKGETDYEVTADPTAWILPYYQSVGRRVTELPLHLSPLEAQRLRQLIDTNMLPANRTYRYNYVYDNCATRPLALVEKAVGDTLRLGAPLTLGRTTFRAMMRSYHRNYPWYQFGIDLALGSGIDRPITFRERAFAPVELESMMLTACVGDSRRGHPLTGSLRELNAGQPGGATLGPTPWWCAPPFVCWTFFALVVLLSWRDFIRRRVSRWADSLVFGIYGIAGLVITFLVFISSHEATSPNWVLLWLNPLCLFGAVGEWVAAWRRAVMSWQILNFALIVALMILALCGVQSLNPAFWPLMLAGAIRNVNYINLTLGNEASARLAAMLRHA